MCKYYFLTYFKPLISEGSFKYANVKDSAQVVIGKSNGH